MNNNNDGATAPHIDAFEPVNGSRGMGVAALTQPSDSTAVGNLDNERFTIARNRILGVTRTLLGIEESERETHRKRRPRLS
jgi:hypothetical protein